MLTKNCWVFSQQLKKNFSSPRKVFGYATTKNLDSVPASVSALVHKQPW